MAKSVKLEIFHGTLGEILDTHFPDYRIGGYFNNEYSAVQWLGVFDHDTNFKVAEAIAVEKFTSRDDAPGLLIIDYVNSDSRRYLDVEQALSFMQIILSMASARKKANASKNQCEPEPTPDSPIPIKADEINIGNINPRKYYLVTSRHNGKTLFLQNLIKNLFGFKIKDVIFNDPATVVLWEDGEKTVVQCQNGEEFDPEKGLAMAITKRLYGNKYSYYDVFKKWVGKHKKKKLRELQQVQTKEETVIANLTLSEVSLSPEDAVAVLRVDGETETKNPREGTNFNDYLDEQLKDPNFKKQFENTEVIRPYCDINKPEDNGNVNS